MGLFDNNIHLNGAGTTYQSFLRLADEAEQKGGKIGDRTVRLVRAGDGLATTTFRGTKGERVTQIGGARKAFLDAIAKEFGYAARNIAEKTLGAADGEPVPLTARTIRAVNKALGDTGALAANSALVREFKTDFDLEVGARDRLFDEAGTLTTDKSREIQQQRRACVWTSPRRRPSPWARSTGPRPTPASFSCSKISRPDRAARSPSVRHP